ncbi:MAG: Txe/YoeB family addiction module toxin [Opitutales bacterium]|nr:Txe/YoeB family addiction module toxin [Opitutales bacterium]
MDKPPEKISGNSPAGASSAAPCRLFALPEFMDDFHFIVRKRPSAINRMLALIKDCAAHPENGKGAPQPLPHLPGNVWSRRLTLEHRLVYRVAPEGIYLLQIRYHY